MAEQDFGLDSKERVALDLTFRIAHTEPDRKVEPDPRRYYLTLYQQCLRVVNGYDVNAVLKDGTVDS
jgi:hypothetical protein